MAAEDFNISIGIDTDSATKGLATFLAGARKTAREARKELASIKTPKIDFTTETKRELKKVEDLVDKINKKKRELGDFSGAGSKSKPAKEAASDARSKTKTSNLGSYGKEIARFEDRILDIKDQLRSLSRIPNPSASDMLNVGTLKRQLAEAQEAMRNVKRNAADSFAEVKTMQKELAEVVADPSVSKAMEEEIKVTRANTAARRASSEKRLKLLKQIEESERGSDVVDAQKRVASKLKEMRASYVASQLSMQKEINATKAELSKATDESTKGKLSKKISGLTSGLREVNDVIGFISEEIEDLGAASTNINSGVKKDLKRLGARGSRPAILGKPDNVGADQNMLPRSLSKLDPGGEQKQQIKAAANMVADIFIKAAQETGVTNPAQAVGLNADQQAGVLKSLVFLAAEQMLPKRITPGVMGEMQASTLQGRKDGTNNAGGIAVVLQDTSASVEEIADSFSEIEEQVSTFLEEASENVNRANESNTDARKSGREALANQDILKGGSRDAIGEMTDAGEDRRRNARDANEGTKEILDFLSSGNIFKDRQTGFWPTTVDASTKLADEGKLKGSVISGEELQLVFEAAVVAFQEIERRLKEGEVSGVGFSSLGPAGMDKAGMRGFYMSSERRAPKFDDGMSGNREEELSESDSSKSTPLKRVPFFENGITPEVKAQLDNGFRVMLKNFFDQAGSSIDQSLIQNVKMDDIVSKGPFGGFAETKPGSAAQLIVNEIKRIASQKPSYDEVASKNESKIKGAFGESSTSAALISVIKQVTQGYQNPQLQSQFADTGAFVEYTAVTEDMGAQILETLNGVNDGLLEILTTYTLLLKTSNKSGAVVGTNMGDPNFSSSLYGFRGNPTVPEMARPFLAAQTGKSTKTVNPLNADGTPAEVPSSVGTVKIENIFSDFNESTADVTKAILKLAEEFKAIYGKELKDVANTKGIFNRDTGLPTDKSDPNAVVDTYLEAFVKNTQSYLREMLAAGTKKIDGGKKDATDKAGGAEIPLDAIEKIFEKLNIVPDGGMLGGYDAVELQTIVKDLATGATEIKTSMGNLDAKTVDALREAFRKASTAEVTSRGAVLPRAEDAIATKYGRQGLMSSAKPQGYNRTENIGLARIFADQENAEREAAKQTSQGLAQGLGKGVTDIEKAGAQTAVAFIDGYENKMQIESPSKRMKKSGEDTVDGLEQGLFEGLASLDAAGRALAGTFHEGYTEQAKVDAVNRIRQLRKEGMDIAAQQLHASMKRPPVESGTMPTPRPGGPVAPAKPTVPATQGQVARSTEEQIAARNQAFLQELQGLKGSVEKNTDAIIALDIETTGPTGEHGVNQVFGYSVVGAKGKGTRDTGALPGTDVVTPDMRGMAHGMVVPPSGKFQTGAAKALGLMGPGGDDFSVIKKTLLERIKGLGYGKENTEGSEEAYIKQLEDIAFILRKIYEEDIPLAIHSASMSDISGLGKEFARLGITAPTGQQLRDKGLLVETQRMAEMTGIPKGQRSVGDIYTRYTGQTMGPQLRPAGNVPTIKDSAAVAHDPTIDSAATLVNAATMRAVQEKAATRSIGLFGEAIDWAGATWKKVSSAIWGERQKNVKNSEVPKSMQRQADPVTGNLQPVYTPGASATTPRTDTAVEFYETMRPNQPGDASGQNEAQEQATAAQEAAKLRDDLEKERARRRRLQANADLQYEADKIEELESMLKQALGEKDIYFGNEGRGKGVDRADRAAHIKKLRDDIKKAKEASPDAAAAFTRSTAAKGGVESDFVAVRQIIAKTDLEKELEKKAKEAAARLDAASGETKTAGKGKGAGRGPGNPIAAPLQELLDAEKRIQGSLQNPDAQLSPQLRKRLETMMKAIQKSIKAGAVGNLTGSELEVFKVPAGLTKVKDRVAGKTDMNKMKKELELKLKQAQEAGNQSAIDSVTAMLKEFEESLAKGPVGKYKNGRDAFAVPDSYRQATMTPAERTPSTIAAGGSMNPSRINHAAIHDQKIEKDQKEAAQFSAQLQGQMKGEMRTMAEVEKANRKMMDGWISSRYALYDVSNTYQQFTRVMRKVGMEVKQAIMTNAAYETSFTSVERSMQPLQDEIAGMRQEIIKLTAELPVAFDELSRVTTLGAQMGIKADGITNFTEQVTKFSAITGLASDTIAQKFGRISQLAKVPSEDFDKLGSAVAYAGISAVATDEQILTLTENIAAAASNSGFTADKIVGLATAMSSLGIAPEQARGVITRLFGDINRAVESGGKPLDAYAKHLGMTADATREMWKSDPQGFFKTMLDALSTSGNMTTALDALNITETREVSTLQKLAENMEVYNQSMMDAQESYANGTFLGDAYAKTQDNIATKMTLVSNQVKMLQDAFGEALGPALSWALDSILSILDGLNAIANNPVGAWAIRVATGLTAMAAAFVAYRMVSMKATASLLAFRTAQVSLTKMGQTDTGLKAFAKMITGQEVLIVRSNGRIEVSNKKAIKSFEQLGMIKQAKPGTPEFNAINANMQPGRGGMDSMDEFGASGAGTRLTDTENGDKLIQTLDHQAAAKKNYVDQTIKSTAATRAEGVATSATSAAKTADAMATKDQAAAIVQQMGIKQSAIVLKENENRALMAGIAAGNVDIAQSRAQIASNNAEIASMNAEIVTLERRKIAILAGNAATAESVVVMDRAGVAAGRFGKAMAFAGPVMLGLTVVLGIIAAIAEKMDSAKVNIEEAGGGLASFRESIYKDTQALKAGGDAYSTYESKVTTSTTGFNDWASSLQKATGATVAAEGATAETTESVKKQTLALGKNSAEWLANAAMQDQVVQGMFKEYFEADKDLAALANSAGTSMQSIIQAALTVPGSGAVDFINETFNGIKIDPAIANKVKEDLLNIAKSLDATTLAGVENSKIWKALIGDLETTEETASGTNTELGKTAERIYTLTNYVSDLGGLLNDAFKIRYGLTESVDKMAGSWKAVKDRLSEARKQLEAINQEIASMVADRGILEYQLQIAVKYGDTVRADKIRAELAKANADIAEKQASKIEAKQNASTKLTGMSTGAIQNRETMRGLISDYNSRITEYANQYTSTTNKVDRARIKEEADRLKADFIAKAQALGFAKNELDPYIKSFTDLKTIVNKLPNTLTLKVVADPGMRAWLEWWAQNKDKDGTAVVKTDTPVPGAPAGGGGGGGGGEQEEEKPKPVVGSKITKKEQAALAGLNSGASRQAIIGDKIVKADSADRVFRRLNEKRGARFDAKIQASDITEEKGFTAQDRAAFFTAEKNRLTFMERQALTREADQQVLEQTQAALPQWVLDGISLLKTSKTEYTKYYSPFYDGTIVDAKDAYKKAAKDRGVSQDPNDFKSIKLKQDKDAMRPYKQTIQTLEANAKAKAKEFADIRTLLNKNGYNATNLKGLLGGISFKKTFDSFASGGYVSGPGTGTSDSIMANVSNGEYVVKAASVSKYGLDFMNAINQQRVTYGQRLSYAPSNSGNGNQMVYLSPDDRALLRSAIDRPVNLYTENARIAQSANAGNVLLAQRGKN